MLTLIIYVAVGLILFFVLYLAMLGINRGVEAKNLNKKNLRSQSISKNIARELKKLKILYNDGAINRKEFIAAKKKLLS